MHLSTPGILAVHHNPGPGPAKVEATCLEAILGDTSDRNLMLSVAVIDPCTRVQLDGASIGMTHVDGNPDRFPFHCWSVTHLACQSLSTSTSVEAGGHNQQLALATSRKLTACNHKVILVMTK